MDKDSYANQSGALSPQRIKGFFVTWWRIWKTTGYVKQPLRQRWRGTWLVWNAYGRGVHYKS